MSTTDALPEPLLRATFESTVRKSWSSGYACERDNQGNYIEGTLRFAWYLVEECSRAALAAQAEKMQTMVIVVNGQEQIIMRLQDERDALRAELAEARQLLTHAGLLAAQEEHNALRAERDALFKAGIETAAALAQCKPLRALSHLEDATHIGHKQFAAAYEKAEDDTKAMAIALRNAIDRARTGGKA